MLAAIAYILTMRTNRAPTHKGCHLLLGHS